jgi:hypothetical protein
MVYSVLADLVMLAHFAGIGFIVAGGLLVWRWPRLAWLHLPAVGWGVAIIVIGFTCPLTLLEKFFRRLAGGSPVYAGGFIDHYLEGVVFPEEFTWLVWTAAGLVVVAGYACLIAGIGVSGARPGRHPAGRRPIVGLRRR